MPADFLARAKARSPWGQFPKPDCIYTVRGHVFGTDGVGRLLLEEIRNDRKACSVGVVEWGFNAKYFRPLVEPKAEAEDVALFHQHLDQSHPVDA